MTEKPAQRPGVNTVPARVKVPTRLQQAQVECGAASLSMVLAHYGRWENPQAMREACGVNRDGSSAVAIAKAAESFGLAYAGHRGEVETLDGLAVPAIIWWRRSHFMVLEGASNGLFHVNDPAKGQYALSRAEFEEQFSGVAITLTKTEAFKPGGKPFRAWPSLWAMLRGSRHGVRYAVVAGMVSMLLGLGLGPVSRVFVDQGLQRGGRDLVLQLAFVLASIGLIRGATTLLEYAVIARVQAKISLVGTAGFTHRLLRLPVDFYLQRAPGDLSNRVQFNTQVASLLANQMASAGIALLAAVAYAALLVYYSWLLALVVLGLTSVNIVVLQLVLQRRIQAQDRVVRHQNQLRGTTASSVRTIESIKSTGMEEDTFAGLAGQQASYLSATAALAPTSALLTATPVAVAALTNASILVVGALLVMHGSLALGTLLAVSALATSLNTPVQTLMGAGSQIQTVVSSLNSLDDVLDTSEDVWFERAEMPDDVAADDVSGAITLAGVTFSYGAGAPAVVKDLSLDLAPGSHVAFVGASGCGKTTVANLIAGLHHPSAGEVRYDGRLLSEFRMGELERSLAKVDQSVMLMEGTVRENVTLWDPTVPDTDVVAALADAQVLDDVLARDGGLDTRVLELGRNFSGGQAQRLEIARALARNPRILVLDEATSALDDITEARVINAVRRRGVSCVVVAHRLSTIRDSEEIIVLGRGGAILERGTHEQLLTNQGPYEQMVRDAGEGGDVGS